MSKKKIRCLVIQLSKLGDGIQSLMALRAAKQLYPELEITIITQHAIAPSIDRIDWIKSCIQFPRDEIVDPIIEKDKTTHQGLSEIARFISPLISEPWDMVVNWSYTDASSYLTSLIPGRIKLGYSRRKDTTFSSVDGWSHYIQAIVHGGIPQNIHLTDILTTQLLTALQIHVGDPENHGNQPVTSRNFFNLNLERLNYPYFWKDSSKKWISIQIGSGHSIKEWTEEGFIKLIESILNHHPQWNIILLGTEKESEKCKRIIHELIPKFPNLLERVYSLVGATDFDLWVSHLAKSQWLIATNTAAIHLASILGTRVINLSIGPVHWNESGPYGNGHYVITSNTECKGCKTGSAVRDEHHCHQTITAESVYATWLYAKDEWPGSRKVSLQKIAEENRYESQISNVQILRSRIRPSEDGGGVVYESVLKRPLILSDWTAMVIGHIARSWYCGWVPAIGQEIKRELLSPVLLQKIRELDESTRVLSKICSECILTAVELNQKAQKAISEKIMEVERKEDIAKLTKKLAHLDNLMEKLAETFPTLSAYTRMSKVLMHNLKGSQLSEITQDTIEAYKQLNEGIVILREWVEFTLNLSKPKVIHLDTNV